MDGRHKAGHDGEDGVKHSFAVVGDRTVLVEPGTRKIVQVIQ